MARHGSGVMNNTCHYIFEADIFKFINKNSQLFNNDFLDKTFRQHKQIMKLLPTDDLLSKDAVDFFKPYGLRRELMTFYQKPFCYNKKAHTDITSTNMFHWYSLNVIISGQGKMSWFSPSTQGDLLRHKDNPDGILYIDFENVNLLGSPVDTWNFGKIALVKTGIPHHTYNDGAIERIVVSIRWDPILDWNSAIDAIRSFICLN
jgi:hypothetical protein